MTTPHSLSTSVTSNRILEIAEHLVQARGFNAFSYADMADALGVTKASVHYHFPTKARLGERLIERYRASFVAALNRIDASDRGAGHRLRAYANIYAEVLESNRMCLCGMMAAEYATLPEPMQAAVRTFFDVNETWLANVLLLGRKSGELSFGGSPIGAARVLVATLEGAMLLARAQGDPARLRSAASRAITGLLAARPAQEKATA